VLRSEENAKFIGRAAHRGSPHGRIMAWLLGADTEKEVLLTEWNVVIDSHYILI
jgi:hypothetical protein